MRALSHFRGLLLVLALLAPAALHALPPAPEQARLAVGADRTAYAAGEPALITAQVKINSGWHVNANPPTFPYLIPTTLELALPAGWPAPRVEYPAPKKQKFAFEEELLAVYDGDAAILARFAVPAGTADGTYPVAAKLTYQACNDRQCLPPVDTAATLELKVGPGGQPAGGGAPASPTPARKPVRFGLMLAFALLGGLILNAMPCVLPVLSLKVFGLVRSSGQGRSEVVRGGLATAAGIVVSFWALALAALAARAAGSAVGWGVQFQQPGFVAFLLVVVVLFCLNLWGLFEILLPQTLARAGAAAPREGLGGHFASGLFATLMATPCSAPFLGTAVGFALSQPAPAILAVFTAVGVGMALPYLLLAAFPASARLLPKPGAWMETLKGVLGFLLAGAAVWLFYVLAGQISAVRIAGIQLGLLVLSLFLWLRHRTGSTAVRRLAGAAVVLAALATIYIAASVGAGAGTAGGPGTARAATPKLIPWTPFDRAKAEALAAGGQLVFVDATAEWCLTCKVNERVILETAATAKLFQEHNVLAMKADWTNRDDEISRFLADHDRYGVPFYVLYRPGREPHVFSEILTFKEIAAAVRGAKAERAGSAG